MPVAARVKAPNPYFRRERLGHAAGLEARGRTFGIWAMGIRYETLSLDKRITCRVQVRLAVGWALRLVALGLAAGARGL